ncbi:hypothetical protein LTS18_009148, partial [Coniosporium uncinatum]
AVFLEFENHGGWGSMGLALMSGQISALYGLMFNDAAAHMAEEVKDASLTVPLAMFYSYLINGTLGLLVLITFLFALPSVPLALTHHSGYPLFYVFSTAMPATATNILSALILVLYIASSIAFNASTARQTFAFARDGGLPFSAWLSRVHPTLKIPANAVWASCILSVLLNLLNLGSTSAFNAIVSLQLVALMFTYILSISCVLARRLKGPEHLPHARWSLGRYGVAVNVTSIVYACFAFFWCFWPIMAEVDAESFNWAPVIFGVVTVTCLGMYVFGRGESGYRSPVVMVDDGFLAERRIEGFGPVKGGVMGLG